VEAANAGLRSKTLVATDCHHRSSTGSINSKVKYGYSFFEATMKIADITGMNHAFWMTAVDHPETGDHFEIDGEPVAAVVTHNAVQGRADFAFSSALIYAGIPDHPEGHDMVVKLVRVFAL
jgi:hypothetical protein